MNAKINKKLFFYPSYSPGVPNTVSLLQGFRPCGKNLFKRCLQNNCKILNLISGHIPVSIAEILVVLSILFALFYIVKTIIRMIKSSSKAFKILCNALVNILTAVSLLYFGFMLLWGINYQGFLFPKLPITTQVPPPQMNCLRYVKVLWSTQIGLENMLRKTTTGL